MAEPVMTETLTLTDFLLARYAEDEAWVSAAPAVDFNGSGERWAALVEYVSHCMSPARVLAECEVKRRIVDLHGPTHTCADTKLTPPGFKEVGPCPTLRALALPYADHPDYRDEWAF